MSVRGRLARVLQRWRGLRGATIGFHLDRPHLRLGSISLSDGLVSPFARALEARLEPIKHPGKPKYLT
jgi:hypothetical protein